MIDNFFRYQHVLKVDRKECTVSYPLAAFKGIIRLLELINQVLKGMLFEAYSNFGSTVTRTSQRLHPHAGVIDTAEPGRF